MPMPPTACSGRTVPGPLHPCNWGMRPIPRTTLLPRSSRTANHYVHSRHSSQRAPRCCATPGQDPSSESDPSSSGRRAGDDADDDAAGAEPLTLGGALAARLARLKALEDYKALLEEPENADTLLRAATLMARHRYPDLDDSNVSSLLDDLARQVRAQLPESRYPLKVLQVINQVLYRQAGFRGNEENYYQADNSCINKVLERKVGIPITLALVYMEVARRVGLPMVGVNLPLHFMIKPAVEGVEVLVDPFKGEICYLEDAEEKISGLMGQAVKIDPGLVQRNDPLPTRKFLYRMLSNLRAVYFTTQQVDSALSIVQYMRATDGSSPVLLRDEGLCYFALRRYPESIDALKEYLAVGQDADGGFTEGERDTILQVIEEARSRMTLPDGG